jgi:hypothetical protein
VIRGGGEELVYIFIFGGFEDFEIAGIVEITGVLGAAVGGIENER